VELDLTGLQMPGLPEQPRTGQIVLRPLERGFGHTLGNTMRRILLSSLRGAAVWAFRADGVLHEHQTIGGVVEDVHQVIRNLKSLVLRMDCGPSSYLFTGDAEATSERAMIAAEPEIANMDVLKLGHHGSRSSTSIQRTSRS